MAPRASNSLTALVRTIRGDRSNRGRSPKATNVLKYASRIVEHERPASAVRKLLRESNVGCKKVALSVVASCDQLDVDEWLPVAIDLSRDDSWEVREYAAEAIAALMLRMTSGAPSALQDLSRDESEEVRRAGAMVARVFLEHAGLRRCAFRVLTSLTEDSSKYVLDAVSPFSLGDQLFRVAPKEGKELLRTLAGAKSHKRRRAAALALQAAETHAYMKDLKGTLVLLLRDADREVSRPAASALVIAARKGALSSSEVSTLLRSSQIRQGLSPAQLKELEKHGA